MRRQQQKPVIRKIDSEEKNRRQARSCDDNRSWRYPTMVMDDGYRYAQPILRFWFDTKARK
jgi:hypothetical protein